ncbi:MAG: FtsX-like permease family protein [Phycisphaerales bacterium]
MPPAWQLARNALSGRPGRTALLFGAVALAAALVVAVGCSIRSAQASVGAGFARFLGNADARVVHPSGGRFEESVLETIRGWPEVAAATGRLGGSLTLVRADGRTNEETGRPLRLTPQAEGLEFEGLETFRRIDLEAGRLPTGPNEILVDPATSRELELEVGDELTVQRFGPPISLTVVGRYARPDLGALQRPRIRMDRGLLGDASGLRGSLTSIYIVLEEGTDVQAFCDQYAEALPAEVSLEPAELVRTGFDRRKQSGDIALRVLTTMAFISAGFIIVIGLTTAVTERQRELAMLRAVGAERRQLFAGQMLTGLGIGAAGAVAGVPIGIALAWALVTFWREYVAEGLVIHWTSVGLAAAGAIAAGGLGALWPAIAAARTSPLEAMSVRARPPSRGVIVLCGIAGLALIAGHHGLFATDDVQQRYFRYALIGLPLLFVGCFLLAVPVVLGVSYVLAPLLGRGLRLPADLLRGTVRATPFRHGFTGGALMIGIALLVSSWAGARSIQAGFIEQIRFADGFAFRPSGIADETVTAIRELPFVDEVTEVGQIQVRIVGEQVFGLDGISPRNVVLVGFDAEAFFRINRVKWLAGDAETALPKLIDGDGILVAEQFLTAKGYTVGDSITLGVGRIEQEFEILGVIGAAGLDVAAQLFGIQSAYSELAVSCVFLDQATVADVFKSSDVHLVQVMLSDEIDDAAAEAAVAEVAPGVLFRSGRSIVKIVEDIAAAMLAIQTSVAFGALILATLAVANVIAADVTARRFEFGVMRSIGTERGTVARLVAAEAVIMGVTGGIIGSLLGLQMAAADVSLIRGLAGFDVSLSLPLGPAAIGWVVLLILSVLAAVPAARRLLRRTPAELVS